MFISAIVGRSLSCAVQRLLPKSLLLTSSPAEAVAQSANRLVSYRAQCANAKGDTKSKDKKEKKKDKKDKKDKKRKSMWLNPECCLDPCPNISPRFDDLYYKPSDKLKRKYTQTWVECPKVKIARKKVCCPQNIIPPPFKRRKRRRAKGKGDECKPGKTDLMSCRPAQPKSKCPRLQLPGCNLARDPPKCLRKRVKLKCTKVCTPYPSFSECVKKKPRPLRAMECRCLEMPSLCEVWEAMRRQGAKKKLSH